MELSGKPILLLGDPPPGGSLGDPFQGSGQHKLSSLFKRVGLDPEQMQIAVGSAVAKQLFKLSKFKLDNWHGTVNYLPSGLPVIPTYHPEFLLNGNAKLTGVVCFDLLRAKAVAEGRYQQQAEIIRVDPDLEWFELWVERLLKAADAGLDPWCAVDVETVEKLCGKEEDSLEGKQNQIVRINFSANPTEGVTVPWVGRYKDLAGRLLASERIHRIFHHWRYDVPLLEKDGYPVARPFHDTMHFWKILQSDLPASLGFIAPFYSARAAWKHLNDSQPGEYAAIDAFQTLRIAQGMARDLQQQGQWGIYMRHIYDLDRLVLHPAERIGLKVDRVELVRFKEQLHSKAQQLELEIQQAVGDDARPLVGGWKKPKVGIDCIEKEELLEVWWCDECVVECTEKHRCPRKKEPKMARDKKPRTRRKKQPREDSAAHDEPHPGLSAGPVLPEEPSRDGMEGASGGVSDGS